MRKVVIIEDFLRTLNTILLIVIAVFLFLLLHEVQTIREFFTKRDFPATLEVKRASLKSLVLREGEIVKVEDIKPFTIELGGTRYILGGWWEYRRNNLLYLIRNKFDFREKVLGERIES